MQEKLENVLASATIPWQIIDSCCYHLYHFQEIALMYMYLKISKTYTISNLFRPSLNMKELANFPLFAMSI